MSRTCLPFIGFMLALSGCASAPQPVVAPPTLAARADSWAYVRLTAEHPQPRSNVTLMRDEIYPISPSSRERGYVFIDVFGRVTAIPENRVERTFWVPSHSHHPEFLSAVADARALIAHEIGCMPGRDLETKAAMQELRTVQELLRIFREYSMQPAEYPAIKDQTAPSSTTSTPCG